MSNNNNTCDDGYTRCRYLDIGLGVVLLVSMLALLQGGWSLQPAPLVIFLTLSLAVLVSYWIWYLYVNIIATNYPVFEEQVEILILSWGFSNNDLKRLANNNCKAVSIHSDVSMTVSCSRSGRSGVP